MEDNLKAMEALVAAMTADGNSVHLSIHGGTLNSAIRLANDIGVTDLEASSGNGYWVIKLTIPDTRIQITLFPGGSTK